MKKNKQKETDASNQKVLVKKYSPAEVRERTLRGVDRTFGLEGILEELGSELLPKFDSGDESSIRSVKERLHARGLHAGMSMGMDTHLPLLETVDEKYQALAKEFASQAIKDYDCTTVLEKAIAEIAANAYLRVIDNSRRLNDLLNRTEEDEYVSDRKMKYLAILSMQLDRVNRQFLSAVVTLQQLKAPIIEMNVRADTAFVSRNQQINVAKHKHEII